MGIPVPPVGLVSSSRCTHVSIVASIDEKILEDQKVDSCPFETLDGVLRRAHDGFVVVEGRVEHQRHSGKLAVLVNDMPVEGAVLPADGLYAGCTVCMRDSWHTVSPSLPDSKRRNHVGIRERGRYGVKNFIHVLLQTGWCKRAKVFTVLDPEI